MSDEANTQRADHRTAAAPATPGSGGTPAPVSEGGGPRHWFRYWRAIAPVAVAAAIVLVPPPAGLAPHAWHFFAIFTGVIVGLVLEPLPGGAVGLIGATVAAVLAPQVLYGPDTLAQPGFKAHESAVGWLLGGFANGTVWLVFGAFMFALGYEKTGLGRRMALLLVRKMGRRTLTLGYAIVLADTLLAPFTPSNTARSGGTVYPVIHNLPPLYGSLPNDPSARKIGSYLMWVAIATTCVTSSLFLTGFAPNLLALELVAKTTKISIDWTDWFVAFAPAGVLLLAVLPLVVRWLYPPQVDGGDEVPQWAEAELAKLGPLTRREIELLALVLLALVLWIFGGERVNATTVALIAVSLMLLLGVVRWDDVVRNWAAWNTLAWLATLVALADGLESVGFVKWFAATVSREMGGLPPLTAMLVLVLVFYFAHYLFASVTAHVTAMLPVMLAVGAAIPGLPMREFALLLCLTLGIMGILTPFATGPALVYYGSGYLPAKDYWRLGAVFGLIYIGALLALVLPWLALLAQAR